MADDTDKDTASCLPASGFTHTHSAVHKWVGSVVKYAFNEFGSDALKMYIWAYREQGFQHLSCDLLSTISNKDVSITLCASGAHYFQEINGGSVEADLYDMAEALHVAGIIGTAMGAEICVGRLNNEINKSVLAVPLTGVQTNGAIKLSFD